MRLLRTFGIGDQMVLKKNCRTEGTVTAVNRCCWLRVKTKPARLYASDKNTAYAHMISFCYQVEGITYTAKRFIPAAYYVPQIGEKIGVYYDPLSPEKYACFAFGPGVTQIRW